MASFKVNLGELQAQLIVYYSVVIAAINYQDDNIPFSYFPHKFGKAGTHFIASYFLM